MAMEETLSKIRSAASNARSKLPMLCVRSGRIARSGFTTLAPSWFRSLRGAARAHPRMLRFQCRRG